MSKDEQRHKFELKVEGEVGDFLGIRTEKKGPLSFTSHKLVLLKKSYKYQGWRIITKPRLQCPLHIYE